MASSASRRRLQDFRDILQDRKYSGDFLFMTRKWEPLAAHKPTCKTDPAKIKQDVYSSQKVQDMVIEVSKQTGKTKEVLQEEVLCMLDEIGYDRKLSIIRWIGYILIKILKKTCSGLLINEGSINRVKSVMGKNPVVFAPSHRSYADFILMSYVCYCFDIDIPVVAAGQDFQSMWLMGRVLRNCCAFFMRRSFGSDRLYWTVFSEYVGRLITDGEAAVEFFIEGTRSRSAKSLSPKYGFLSMVLEPFFSGRVDDVVIVPINISYDRTLEETLFAYELLGVPKPKESTSGLLKALNILNESYGRVYVDFAEPISVKQFITFAPQVGIVNEAHNVGISHDMSNNEIANGVTNKEVEVCVDLAFHVIRQQQHHAVITPFNLIAVVMNHAMFDPSYHLNKALLVKEIVWLKPIMEVFGALVDFYGKEDAEEVVEEAVSVHRNLTCFTAEGDLVLTTVQEQLDGPMEYKLSAGHGLFSQTMKLAVPVVMLQHYVNPCLSYFINPALINVIMLSLNDPSRISKGELVEKFSFLRVLLLHEFVFYKTYAGKDFEECLHHMCSLNLVEISKNHIARGTNVKLQALLAGLLQPFLYGYLALCRIIKEITTPKSSKDIVGMAQRRIEKELLLAYPVHPYSLSLNMHGCALRSLEILGAVEKIKIRGRVKYQPGSKLVEVMMHIEKYALQVVLQVHRIPLKYNTMAMAKL